MLASSRLKPVPLKQTECGRTKFCGTGFSREGVRRHTVDLRVHMLASSRLKPVPTEADRVQTTESLKTGYISRCGDASFEPRAIISTQDTP
jgi:hypothetical protein